MAECRRFPATRIGSTGLRESIVIDSISAADYLAGAKKQSKYRNVKTEVDGIVFDSAKEAGRYGELKYLIDAGEIQHLVLQPKLQIEIEGVLIGSYFADFLYFDVCKGEHVYEDVKGMRTETYRLKKKLVEAQYGIEITEITK